MVPPVAEEEWPTLGPQVCDFIEAYLVFGPGDLRGQPPSSTTKTSLDVLSPDYKHTCADCKPFSKTARRPAVNAVQ